MKKWKCLICGEIVESDVRPDKCPLCKAPGEKFVEVVEDDMTWATEHEVGIIDGVPQEIIDGLRANFNGECTEVGMYLAMARVAFREGYPEIGLYWEKAAYEEAEHAAKFAEMLPDNERLTVNGEIYVHWYDCISDYILGGKIAHQND